MQAKWTKEWNMLNVESLRGLLFLQYIFKGILYTDFRTCLKSNVQLLKQTWQTEKYEKAQKKEDDYSTGDSLCTVCIVYTYLNNFF